MERKLGFFFTSMLILFIIAVPSHGQEAVAASARVGSSKSVKKDLNVSAAINTDLTPTPLEIHNIDGSGPAEDVVLIEEKPHQMNIQVLATQEVAAPTAPLATGQVVEVEETDFKQNIYRNDDDLPDSFKTGFYFFIGLSSVAVLFIIVKVYRLRLSRAERKYGVQGDRSTQELTPLPISIEDGNSDEDDQTLFEINRQQIRIL